MSEPFTVEVPVRYRDLDPLNHVNHAVYASYLEIARTEYLDEVVGLDGDTVPFVIVDLQISYERPILKGDEPTVALWITDLGDSSVAMEYEIRVDGEVAATAESTIVHVDPESQRPTPLPDELREPMLDSAGLEATA